MEKFNNHLYMILYPMEALVGSHLEYQAFAKHFVSGSSKFYSGKLIFAEIDPTFRHSYFNIEGMLKLLVPHEDGRPKATKYVSTYRVLEHMNYDYIRQLYISTPEGYVLPLSEGPYEAKHQEGYVRLFGEIAPLSMSVLSDYNFLEFSKYITNPNNSVGAPRMFYTQIDLDIEEFLKDFEQNPLRPSPVPGVHPSILTKAIGELKTYQTKHTKSLALSDAIGNISFKHLRHGFIFASENQNKFFPLPHWEIVEREHYKFWKHM